MESDLRQTLLIVAETMRDARDPWWVIASAAMALHGVTPIEVADVDVLASVRDAARVLATLRLPTPPASGTDRFRSTIFARLDIAPVPIELMAGFHVRDGATWRPILPETRILITLGDTALPVPSVAELIAHCALFGRPKDKARAALLQQWETERAIRSPSA
jgi:hypothetical protein